MQIRKDSNCIEVQCVQGKAAVASKFSEYVPDQIGTLAQVETRPNLGWPNKELRGSQPV